MSRPARLMQGRSWLRLTMAGCALLGFLLVGLVAGGASAGATERDRPDVGTAAPDFVLPMADREGTMRLSSLRGRPAVVTFWAFWCDTWREVRQGYRSLADAHTPATLVAVAVDPTRVELLRQEDDAPVPFYPILVDRDRTVSETYHVVAVPTVLVLDAAGVIRYRTRGWPGPDPILRAVAACAGRR